ncbi:MAG TPA: YggT family protein [Gammaproteobacteria bacterium]|nr:YggT family protein [Gammaproteobacteria bacterium]
MQYSLIYLVRTFSDLYLLTFLLRFVMQWARADFYNPVAQFVVRVTNPLVVPARRFLPRARFIDAPTLIVLVALEALVTWLLLAIGNFAMPGGYFVALVILRLIDLTLWLYTLAILIYAVLSWISQGHTPIGALLEDLVAPVLRPVRRVIPLIGGLDLSPLIVLILIQAIRYALPLPGLLR